MNPDTPQPAVGPLEPQSLAGLILVAALAHGLSAGAIGERELAGLLQAWNAGRGLALAVGLVAILSALSLLLLWLVRGAPRPLATLGLFATATLTSALVGLHQWGEPGNEYTVVLFCGIGGGLSGGLLALFLPWDEPDGAATSLVILFGLLGMFGTTLALALLSERWPQLEWLLGLKTLVMGGVAGAALGQGLSWRLSGRFDRIGKLVVSAASAGVALRIAAVAFLSLA